MSYPGGYRDALRTKDGRRPRWVLTLYPGTALTLRPERGGTTRDLQELAPDHPGGIGAVPCGPGVANGAQLQGVLRRLLARFGSARAMQTTADVRHTHSGAHREDLESAVHTNSR